MVRSPTDLDKIPLSGRRMCSGGLNVPVVPPEHKRVPVPWQRERSSARAVKPALVKHRSGGVRVKMCLCGIRSLL